MSRGRPKTGKRKEWTAQEESALRDLTARGLTYAEIARLMGRSRNSVLVKAGRIQAGNRTALHRRRRDAVDPADAEALFWSQVNQSDGPDACWPWTGSLRSNGYGWFYERGGGPERGIWQAHRFAYRSATGVHPRSRYVCHACDNPPCCNPAHLWLGDAKANSDDAASKGRLVAPPLADWPKRMADRPHHWARLKPADVIEVRHRALSGENQTKIGADFGIGSRAISKIKLGKRWRHA